LQFGPASAVATIDKLSVVRVSVFGALVLGEQLILAGWGGVAMIAAGAILVGMTFGYPWPGARHCSIVGR
jgi:transporter family protein